MARLIRVIVDNVAILNGVYDTGDEVTISDEDYQALLDANAVVNGLIEDLGDIPDPGEGGGGGGVTLGETAGTAYRGDRGKTAYDHSQSTGNPHGTVAADIADLGDAATKNVGTTAGTVAAGNDSRIVGAAQKASNLSDLANAATARTNLGLGTAATQPATAFDPSGSAAAAQAAAIAASDPVGSAAAAQAAAVAASQPLDADLTAISALVSAANKMPYSTGAGVWSLADLTAFARTLLAAADAAAVRTELGVTATADTSLVKTEPTGSTGFDTQPNGTLWVEYTP